MTTVTKPMSPAAFRRLLEERDRFWRALHTISKYMPPRELETKSERVYGLTPSEATEYAYENVLNTAKGRNQGNEKAIMTTDTEALRRAFEAFSLDGGLTPGDLEWNGRFYIVPFTQDEWLTFQAGYAAAKAEIAAAGEPVAWAHFAKNGNIRLWAPERPRDLDGNAAHPLYTADQLAAAVAKERERAAMVCERIADDYNRSDCLTYPELMTDAGTGANDCAAAIRAGARNTSDA